MIIKILFNSTYNVSTSMPNAKDLPVIKCKTKLRNLKIFQKH